MQALWGKSSQPAADPKTTLEKLAAYCKAKKEAEEELQQRVERLTANIKATPKGPKLTPAERKRCCVLLAEKRQCERELDKISEQRLHATFRYNAIQSFGREKEFVDVMKVANDCMESMGLLKMRDQAEHASDTASDLASYKKELEDVLERFGSSSFGVDNTEFDDELDEILGLPREGSSPAVLTDAPGAVSVSSSSFPRVPVASPKAAATSKQPAKETRPSVVSV